MEARLQNFLRAFSLPAVPLVAALLAWPLLDELSPIWLERAPWLLAVCAGLLALRFHRSSLALSLFATLMLLPSLGLPASLLSVLVPLDLLLIALTPQAEAIWLFVLAVQGLTLRWLSQPMQDGLLHRWEVLTVAPVPFVVSGCALGLLARRAFKTPMPLEGAQLAVALAALAGMASGPAAPVWSAAAGLAVLIGLVQHTYRMAYLDELTEIPGRRALKEEMSRLRGNYAIAMLDVDHFKKFNDTYGHDVGDQVLRLVASRLKRAGGGGRAFRYGGEEFTIVFPGGTVDDAWEPLDEIRQVIEATPMTLRAADRPKKKPTNVQRGRGGGGEKVSVTISIGVAERSDKQPTPDRVVKAADKALYKAKKNGRNQVAC